ncbi:MAG: DoxX family protein [Actinomycetota bacterium]|nr:DoxX family protein [Actinomycetota bacterium]
MRSGRDEHLRQTAVAAELRQQLIALPDAAVRRDRAAGRVAVITGVFFVVAGLVKFVFHAWELKAFRAFGLPWPDVSELFAGVLEVGGGVLLIARSLVVPVSALLAATMVVAIGASGVGHGDVIPSLTLAPVLLGSLVWLTARSTNRR